MVLLALSWNVVSLRAAKNPEDATTALSAISTEVTNDTANGDTESSLADNDEVLVASDCTSPSM